MLKFNIILTLFTSNLIFSLALQANNEPVNAKVIIVSEKKTDKYKQNPSTIFTNEYFKNKNLGKEHQLNKTENKKINDNQVMKIYKPKNEKLNCVYKAVMTPADMKACGVSN